METRIVYETQRMYLVMHTYNHWEHGEVWYLASTREYAVEFILSKSYGSTGDPDCYVKGHSYLKIKAMIVDDFL